MEPKNNFSIVVEYYGDPTKIVDDHDSELVYLTEINEQYFSDISEAIKFLSYCKSPITTIDQLMPLVKKPKGFKFILPEQNIKIKHQADNVLDSKFDLDDIDWG